MFSGFRRCNGAQVVIDLNCMIERFSIECRKTKTKVITLANHNRCKERNEPIMYLKQIHVTGAKRGKKRASEALLVLVLLLIG